MKNFTLFTLISLFLFSCSTIHKNGYYQTKRYPQKTIKKWMQTKQHSKKNNPIISEEISEEMGNFEQFNTPSLSLATIENPDYNFEPKIQTIEIEALPNFTSIELDQVQVEDSCDRIYLNNGDEVDAIVMEIGKDEVKYKRCDFQDGPLIIVDKDDIHKIKYRNGTMDVFSKSSSASSAKKKSGASTAILVIGWLLVIFATLTLIFYSILLGLIMAGIGFLFIIGGS